MEKIAGLQRSSLPIFEPGLEKLVPKNVAAGRLSFTTDLLAAVQPADEGDTATWRQTVETACQYLNDAKHDPEAARNMNGKVVEELVNDKGYHSNAVLKDYRESEIRTYISEPDRGRRNWKDKPTERDAVYANRRRIRGARG